MRAATTDNTADRGGTVQGWSEDSLTTWGQQPHQYMAVRGRPDTVIAVPGGVRFSYVVRPQRQERDNAPDPSLKPACTCLGRLPLRGSRVQHPPKNIKVHFEVPGDWDFSSAFADGSVTFKVSTPQDLHSSAFMMGRLRRSSFTAGGVAVELAVRREVPVPAARFEVLTRLLGEMRYQMGPLPVARVMFGADYRGERKSNAPANHESTNLQSSVLFTYGAEPPNPAEFVGSIAHELNHMWIPGALGDLVQAKSYDAFGPFFMEGFTNYFAYRLSYDAGLLTQEQFAERLSGYWAELGFVASAAGERWRGALPYSQGLFAAMVLDIELMRRDGEPRFYDAIRLLAEAARTAGGQGVTLETFTPY